MDKNVQSVLQKRMERTAAALRKNRFDAHVVQNREALLQKLQECLPAGASCAVGGSMTLFEAGVIDLLRSGDYTFYDRYAEGTDAKQVFRQSFSCDVYLASANAVTEEGEIYNMDGNGNRVAAIAYGPDKVILVAGCNKIVSNLEEARERNRRVAAPANARRLNKEGNPCYHTGICSDCSSPTRFCSHELVCHFQMVENRITVFLVGEELGY